MIVGGILIFFNDEHPSNAYSPIEFNDVGSFISVNKEQPKNACGPIVLTVYGIDIRCNDLHS